MSEKINCPKCGYQISTDEAIVQRMLKLKLEQARPQMEEELKKKLSDEQSNILRDLQNQLVFEKKKREEAEKNELALRKERETLNEEKKSWELEKKRQIDEERKELEEKIRKDAEEENRFKLLERDKKIEDMKIALDEARRKGAQGSMQTQGEVLELSLKHLLKQTFPSDKIDDVPKGVPGADIIQTVIHRSGQPAGIIVWESKRTKNWSEGWIQKLKDDSRNIKADYCVLVSEVLPKEIDTFNFYNDIWVCNYLSISGLATSLRLGLLAAFNIVTINTNKDEKQEDLYNYVTSTAFIQKIKTLGETFMNMQQTLEQEKRALMKSWTTRETQIYRLQKATSDICGTIEGIGLALPNIDFFKLESEEEIEKQKTNTDQKNLF